MKKELLEILISAKITYMSLHSQYGYTKNSFRELYNVHKFLFQELQTTDDDLTKEMIITSYGWYKDGFLEAKWLHPHIEHPKDGNWTTGVDLNEAVAIQFEQIGKIMVGMEEETTHGVFLKEEKNKTIVGNVIESVTVDIGSGITATYDRKTLMNHILTEFNEGISIGRYELTYHYHNDMVQMIKPDLDHRNIKYKIFDEREKTGGNTVILKIYVTHE